MSSNASTRAPGRKRRILWMISIPMFMLLDALVWTTTASATSTAVPLKPSLDISSSGIRGVINGATVTSGLWQAVDDGTSFALADGDTSRVETVPGVTGSHTIGYSGAPAGTVSNVVVNVRARRTKFARGSVRVVLYDGGNPIASGTSYSLGTSYANISASFTNLDISDANRLRTEVQLQSTATRGNLMYTQVWTDLTYKTADNTTPPLTGTSDLLSRKDLIYGSEIGAWRTTGKPATDPNSGIPTLVKAAKVPLIRFAVYDVFNDMTDPLGNPGTQSRANFDAALNSIRSNLGAEVAIKLLPISKDVIGTKNGSIYCPPLNNLSRNLDYYKALLAQAGPRVRIYESTNEMEYVCAKTWGFSSAGSPGVSKALGEHFAQNMPALKKYARSLGIDIVTVGYIGTPGGFGWGDSIAKPRTSTATEFLTATHDAYVASGYDPDYIPDAISIHAYPNSPDFGANATLSDIIAYYESWKSKVQNQMNTIWGPAIGSNMKMAISEWNAGSKDWAGFSDNRVIDFYSAWLAMLKRDNYWFANQFAIASNGSEPYDMIKENGSTTPFYNTFKTASVAAP